MKGRVVIVISCFILLIVASIYTVNAQSSVLGASKGEVLSYSTTHTIYSSTTDQQNFTIASQYRIDDISGNIVSITRTPGEAHYSWDISQGYFFSLTDQANVPFILFSPPSLNAGDSFKTFTSSVWTINETIVRHYGAEIRETNHFSQVVTLSPQVQTSADFYFDKKTGLLVEYITATNSTNTHDDLGNPITPYNLVDRQVLTDTSLWKVEESSLSTVAPSPTVPEFSAVILLPLFAVMLLCAVVVRAKKKANKNHS